MPSKVNDFRGMSDEQLGLTLRDTEKHVFQLRFQSATDRLETPSELRKAKRELAQIKTIQRERELAKLREVPAEQLASRIAALEAITDQPRRRLRLRQVKRLKALHAAKAAPAGAGSKARTTSKKARAASKGSK
jgi:large subunit ribosomal protein L29